MKDTILKIIFNHIGNVVESTPHYQSASEIAEMMTAFIEWVGLEYGFHTLDIREIDMKWLHPLYSDKWKEYTTEELFTYWHTEIYKKQ